MSAGQRRVEVEGALRVAKRRLGEVNSVVEAATRERQGLDGFLGSLRGLFGGRDATVAHADSTLAAVLQAQEQIQQQVADLELQLVESTAKAAEEAAATEALEATRAVTAGRIAAKGGVDAEALELLDAQAELTTTATVSSSGDELTDVRIVGTVDTRGVAVDDACLLVQALGVSCVPCADGQPLCLDVDAEAPFGQLFASIDIDGTCML